MEALSSCEFEMLEEVSSMRVNILLECTECGDRNYLTKKNKRNNPERLEVKKYCPRLRKMTLHREVKK